MATDSTDPRNQVTVRALSDAITNPVNPQTAMQGVVSDTPPQGTLPNSDPTPAPAPTGLNADNPNYTIHAITPTMQTALDRYFAAKPDQKAVFEGPQFNGDALSYINSTVGWWNSNADSISDARLNSQEFAPEMALLGTLGFDLQGGTQPLEQDLLNRVLTDYVYPSLANDQTNGAAAQGYVDQANQSFDQALQINQKFVNSGMASAGQNYFNANPDVAKAYKDWGGVVLGQNGDKPMSIDDFAKWHYDTYGKDSGRPGYEAGVQGQLKDEYANADSVAKSLGDSAIAEQTTRLAALDAQHKQISDALDANLAARNAAVDARTGQLKAGSTALDAQKLADLDAQTAQLRTGLDQLNTERQASLATLNDTRLKAAQGQVTAVNQGLQRTQDTIAANQAAQGFVGNGSMDDANLARAVIGARQQAAGVAGDARVTNATDQRNLNDDISGKRFDITTNDATGRRTINDDGAQRIYDITGQDATDRYGNATNNADQHLGLEQTDAGARVGAAYDAAAGVRAGADKGTAMKSTYFDTNTNRQLSSALLPAQLATQRLSLLDAAGAAGQSGLTRSLQNLGFFATGATPSSQQNYTATASQSGNDIAALGSGILSSGLSVANANNWWQSPKSSTVQSTVIPGSSAAAGGNTMTPYTVTASGGG